MTGTIIQISQAIISPGEPSDCWVCHPQPTVGNGKSGDPLIKPIYNSTFLSDFTVNQNAPLTSPFESKQFCLLEKEILLASP